MGWWLGAHSDSTGGYRSCHTGAGDGDLLLLAMETIIRTEGGRPAPRFRTSSLLSVRQHACLFLDLPCVTGESRGGGWKEAGAARASCRLQQGGRPTEIR